MGIVNGKVGTAFSVVVPVFNERENLQPLHSRLSRVMAGLKKPFEIIYVDDGSSDGSFEILRALQTKDKSTRVIRFTRNFGQHPAIMAGFNASRGEVMITLDADLQNPPEEIPKLIKKLDEGYEVVFGVFQERKHSPFRRAGSWFAKWALARVLPVDVAGLSGFRAVKSCAVDQLKSINEKSKFLDGLLCWMGYRVGTVEVQHDERRSGKTKYTLSKLTGMWLDMIISFTDFPLKIATLLGLVLGAVSLILALFYFIRYFAYGYSVPGFATTAILITFFSGIQLFSLGVLGEYMGRVNREVKNKAEYIVRDIYG